MPPARFENIDFAKASYFFARKGACGLKALENSFENELVVASMDFVISGDSIDFGAELDEYMTSNFNNQLRCLPAYDRMTNLE